MDSRCPCCKQKVSAVDPVDFPTNSKERVRLWTKLAIAKINYSTPFTVPIVGAIVETIADQEDLEEIHHILLLKHIRRHLDQLCLTGSLVIIREGKRGRSSLYQRRAPNANAN
jgi:hypothetical protein